LSGYSAKSRVYLALCLLSVAATAQSLEGVVRDSVTGAPLAKASVRLTPEKGKGGSVRTTDPLGKFRFDAIEAGDYKAEVGHRGTPMGRKSDCI
jgi:hypothetical protein